MIEIVKNFVDVTEFINYKPVYISTNDIWNERIAQLPQNFGGNLLKKIHKTINKNLTKTVWADTINYAKWRIGDYQTPHADGENLDGSEHVYSWREFGCVLYLNDDYEGGEIYFPQHNFTVKPESGTLVWFPGTTKYMHGVNEVTNGVRLTIASFWGSNPPQKHPLYQYTSL